MKLLYSKTLFITLMFFFSIPIIAQHQKGVLPQFNNPFLKKSLNSQNPILQPQNDSIKDKDIKIEKKNGSFYFVNKKEKISLSHAIENINTWLNLNNQFTFIKKTNKKDNLGFTHLSFQPKYKNIPIEGNILMIHVKDGNVYSINGNLIEFKELSTNSTISKTNAEKLAKKHLNVTKLIQNYPIETVIYKSSQLDEPTLTYKVRIDSYAPFVMCHVYVNALSGTVINKVNLIAHADVSGTAETLYSSTQPITCDSHNGGFRLRENERAIETYDATNATDLNENGFVGAVDFTSSSSDWDGVTQLNSFTINTVSQDWWHTTFTDELPDLYLVIKDAFNQVVLTSSYLNNTNPPLQFTNLNVLLNTPPYTVELWDVDGVFDDFGGSYSISSNSGTQSWSGEGNSGSYEISVSGHPALDVHWGMEVSYDFYLDAFNRDSFDGNGSLIKQYLNPQISDFLNAGYPNNASALGSPYNIMSYGIGDGINMNPMVGLDVEGHEFTHLVVNNNGNGGLVYEGESGALNESFADIFGTCIEYYSGINPDWTIGEDVEIMQPYTRSMSNPNSREHPDTYNGQHWINPANLDYDNGGVHINSGVQNYWFYLLSQGGSGTNDLGNFYSVSGIGLSEASQIAYRNLVTYLGSNATYGDTYWGSLQSTEDLYGITSSQYDAVKQAWYAVGIGTAPNNYCDETTNLTQINGTISDGSGSTNYNDNSSCTWVISPSGANQITLDFTYFDTEWDYDKVFIYDGPDDTSPILMEWWGNTLPFPVSTSSGVGAMCIKFTSDASITGGGWSANYTSTGITPPCDGVDILAAPTGLFNDGSGGSNYVNNQLCYWYIAPPCANSVTLSFSQFDTEDGYDGLIIYDDWEADNQLAVLTGTTIPNTVTSNTGKMLIIFVSDYAFTMQGFTASYSSTGSALCSGINNLNNSDWGVLSDGSGTSSYCNNLECSWLIQPPQANQITLTFTDFDIELASSDGYFYDFVEVYDGSSTLSPLLGRFTGNNIPPSISSSNGSMLIRFSSDLEVVGQGWSAYYTSTQNEYCSSTTILTSPSGSLTDGSGFNQYANNANCFWLVQPPNANTITLNFTTFNTEQDYDGVIVYDGTNSSAPIIGQFTGNSIPPSLTANSGSMYVEFLSDITVRDNGWNANYTSTIATSVDEIEIEKNLVIFPNPNNGIFTIKNTTSKNIEMKIFNILGQEVFKSEKIFVGNNKINLEKYNKGIYLLEFTIADKIVNKKIVIE